ncbi:MAG: aromatic ring-hydroxylating oxygenase subunit alpha [Candidatus Promineifilaceae bacterium]
MSPYYQPLTDPEIDTLLANHREGYALDRAFYTDPAIFETEFTHLISRQWHYVDHINRIPKKGDYFLFRIAGEQLIIVRGDEDTVYAHYNVCRHRGSRVCLEETGNTKRLTCPYHAWSYRLDGSLANARAMSEQFDPSNFGLKSCPVRLFEGMIFINMAQPDQSVPAFDEIVRQLKPWIERADLRRTKIIKHETYQSQVNWKIALENYFECYHCITSHPELCKVQLHTLRDAVATPKANAIFETHNAQWQQHAQSLGHKTGGMQTSRQLNDAENYLSQAVYAERMLVHHDLDAAYAKAGVVAPKPSGKLLGSYVAEDNGQVDWGIMPSVFMYTTCSNTVIFRITPLNALETEMSQTWLVHEDAAEGVDYDVESSTWLDEVTMAQDEEIVVNTQAGVSSRAYEPGPYAELEGEILEVHRNYLRMLKFGRGLIK